MREAKQLEGPARGDSQPPRRVTTSDGMWSVTLSDWYRDRLKGRAPADRLRGCKDICSVLSVLGFDLPREAYAPAPDQHAFRAEKNLVVPAAALPGVTPDCDIRFCAPKTCWLFVERVEVTPLNLTAGESLVVRPSIFCGTQRLQIDFCGVVGHAHESPGEFTKPQRFMVPPTGCFVLTPYNLDEFSDALVGVEVYAWLVPPEADERAAR